jgi:hypothetical protein
MNRLLDPPAIIRQVQSETMECTACGASADATVHATCNCKAGFKSKMQLATKYAEQNPTASVREIAERTGVGVATAHEAKAGVRHRTPETVTGRDGKSYPATKPHTDEPQVAPDLTAQARKHLDKIVDLLRRMDQRERLSFRTAALRQMADAHLDENVVEF